MQRRLEISQFTIHMSMAMRKRLHSEVKPLLKYNVKYIRITDKLYDDLINYANKNRYPGMEGGYKGLCYMGRELRRKTPPPVDRHG